MLIDKCINFFKFLIFIGGEMEKKEYNLPIEDVWGIEENKYKALVIIIKEARRIFHIGAQSPEKPVVTAMKRFVDGEIEYTEEKD